MYQEKPTYRSEVIAALRILGGQGHLKDIYDVIIERNKLEAINTKKHWRGDVRANLQRYSSDSKNYLGKEDIFYSVGGLGGGIWGIRDLDVLYAPETFDFISDGEYKNVNQREFAEGMQKQIVVNSYERNTSLRRECIKLYGTDCKICTFNFEKHYGIRGKGFIEIHHLVPLSEIKQDYFATPDDLLPLCSNCHSIIHRFKPFLTVEEMKNICNF
ncbi:MAG: HNH endonuclease [Oscillospiraceae bacterium]|nr:HNH endonuclease [Oscillospiraceae bacterium]